MHLPRNVLCSAMYIRCKEFLLLSILKVESLCNNYRGHLSLVLKNNKHSTVFTTKYLGPICLPECSACILVYIWNLVTEQCHEGRDAAQLPRLRLHRVVHVAEVLQVRRRVGLQ